MTGYACNPSIEEEDGEGRQKDPNCLLANHSSQKQSQWSVRNPVLRHWGREQWRHPSKILLWPLHAHTVACIYMPTCMCCTHTHTFRPHKCEEKSMVYDCDFISSSWSFPLVFTSIFLCPDQGKHFWIPLVSPLLWSVIGYIEEKEASYSSRWPKVSRRRSSGTWKTHA